MSSVKSVDLTLTSAVGGSYTLTYDNLNNMKTFKKGTNTLASFAYDGDGMRVTKTTWKTIVYHYDKDGRSLSETDNNGNLIADYIYLNGKLVAKAEPSNLYFYHTDPAGTALAMTNNSGTVVWKTDYKPFGEEQSTNPSTIENNVKFAGKEKDKETGLYYDGARYHGPKTGHFITVDPVGAVDEKTSNVNAKMLMNPQRLNRYAYALNNPYRYIDTNGEMATEVGFVFGTVIAPGPGTILGTTIGGIVDAGLGLTGAYIVYKAGEAIYNEVTGKEEGSSGVGQTASGQATDKYGNKLGPSGKPVRHKVEHSTEKGAKDASRQEGERSVKHPSPEKGNRHYHPADAQGNKIPGSTHHEY